MFVDNVWRLGDLELWTQLWHDKKYYELCENFMMGLAYHSQVLVLNSYGFFECARQDDRKVMLMQEECALHHFVGVIENPVFNTKVMNAMKHKVVMGIDTLGVQMCGVNCDGEFYDEKSSLYDVPFSPTPVAKFRMLPCNELRSKIECGCFDAKDCTHVDKSDVKYT